VPQHKNKQHRFNRYEMTLARFVARCMKSLLLGSLTASIMPAACAGGGAGRKLTLSTFASAAAKAGTGDEEEATFALVGSGLVECAQRVQVHSKVQVLYSRALLRWVGNASKAGS